MLQSGVTEKLIEYDMPCKLCISSDEWKTCDNGKEWQKLVGQIVRSIFFFNTLCMLHPMLVIWNFMFGHKGEVEKGQCYIMRNCNLCQCG